MRKAKDWVDANCFFYQSLSFENDTITNMNEDWLDNVYIFGRNCLENISSFSIHIKNFTKVIQIGIVNSATRHSKILGGSEGKVCYENDRICFNGSSWK